MLLALFKTLYKLSVVDVFFSFNPLFEKTRFPAPKAIAPIPKESKIDVSKTRYGTAKNTQPKAADIIQLKI